MIALVTRSLEYPEEDEASRYRSVKKAQKDQRRNHEGEGQFLVKIITQGSESGCNVVLGPGVGVDDSGDHAEDNNLADGDSPESLGEIFRVLHLGDEARNRNLSNESVAYVEESIHSANESSICDCDD